MAFLGRPRNDPVGSDGRTKIGSKSRRTGRGPVVHPDQIWWEFRSNTVRIDDTHMFKMETKDQLMLINEVHFLHQSKCFYYTKVPLILRLTLRVIVFKTQLIALQLFCRIIIYNKITHRDCTECHPMMVDKYGLVSPKREAMRNDEVKNK